jgi:hypothetical protein
MSNHAQTILASPKVIISALPHDVAVGIEKIYDLECEFEIARKFIADRSVIQEIPSSSESGHTLRPSTAWTA